MSTCTGVCICMYPVLYDFHESKACKWLSLCLHIHACTLNTKYIYNVCVGRQVLNCVCLPLSVFGQAPKKFHCCIFLVWTIPTRLHETAFTSRSKCSVQALHHVKNVRDQTGESFKSGRNWDTATAMFYFCNSFIYSCNTFMNHTVIVKWMWQTHPAARRWERP